MAKTEMEMLEDISASQKETKAALTQSEQRFLEAKQIAEAANKKIDDEVKTINETLTNQGKTLEEINKEITEFKAKTGRFKASGSPEERHYRDILAEEFKTHFEEIKAVRKGHGIQFETKDAGVMTASANLTGSVVASYAALPATRGRRKVHFQDLFPTIQSSTGVWKFYRQNAVAGEGSFGTQSTHGAAKAQLDYDLTEVTVTAEYLAGFVRFAKQMAEDLPFLQSFIANELIEDYKRAESAKFFGLLISAATGSATTGSSVYAEKMIDWIANMMEADYDPTAFITTAANWATLLKTKPSDYSVPGGVTITPDGTVMIAGVPVYVANSAYMGGSTNKTVLVDASKVVIVERSGLQVNFYEQDSDNVQKNLITAKAERRVGLAILRTDAIIYA